MLKYCNSIHHGKFPVKCYHGATAPNGSSTDTHSFVKEYSARSVVIVARELVFYSGKNNGSVTAHVVRNGSGRT